MKSSIKKNILFLLLVLSLSACSENKNDKQADPIKPNQIVTQNSSNLKNDAKILIYDYNSKGAGLELKSIDLKNKTTITKKDIVNTFLNHNHFIQKENRISLSRIEEVGDQTIFHLTSVEDLKNPKDLRFFKKALELTLLRHLKTNDFNIIYGLTAQL